MCVDAGLEAGNNGVSRMRVRYGRDPTRDAPERMSHAVCGDLVLSVPSEVRQLGT